MPPLCPWKARAPALHYLPFPTIGYIAGYTNMNVAFLVVSGMMFLAGLLWLAGMKYLPADTAAVEAATNV